MRDYKIKFTDEELAYVRFLPKAEKKKAVAELLTKYWAQPSRKQMILKDCK